MKKTLLTAALATLALAAAHAQAPAAAPAAPAATAAAPAAVVAAPAPVATMPATTAATPAAIAATPAAAAAGPAPAAAASTAAAAPASYPELMAQTIDAIMHTGSAATLADLAARLERAATVAPTDWLPRYYQAYALVISVFQSKEKGDAKDATLDRAEAALAQARQLGGDASELLTLQAYLYQARLGISPMLRSQKYSGLVMQAVAQAQALNPNNPRPYLVQANNVYYTPAMFGGGADKARPLYEAARAKFDAFQPASALAPNWGKGQTLGRLKAYETGGAAVLTH